MALLHGFAALGCVLLAAAPAAAAQEDELQVHITDAVSALQQLDSLAKSCLDALEQDGTTDGTADGTTNAQALCSAFMTGVDGELLARYLAHCRVLRDWRDTWVSNQFTDAGDRPAPESDVRILVGTDYACGENALQLRTEFVTTAFNQLQAIAGGGAQQNATLARRLAETRFDATLAAERERLQNAVEQQQRRRELETERQRQRVENELIRQQINAPDF